MPFVGELFAQALGSLLGRDHLRPRVALLHQVGQAGLVAAGEPLELALGDDLDLGQSERRGAPCSSRCRSCPHACRRARSCRRWSPIPRGSRPCRRPRSAVACTARREAARSPGSRWRHCRPGCAARRRSRSGGSCRWTTGAPPPPAGAPRAAPPEAAEERERNGGSNRETAAARTVRCRRRLLPRSLRTAFSSSGPKRSRLGGNAFMCPPRGAGRKGGGARARRAAARRRGEDPAGRPRLRRAVRRRREARALRVRAPAESRGRAPAQRVAKAAPRQPRSPPPTRGRAEARAGGEPASRPRSGAPTRARRCAAMPRS